MVSAGQLLWSQIDGGVGKMLAAVMVVVMIIWSGGVARAETLNHDHSGQRLAVGSTTPDPYENYSKVSCDFSRDSCGWHNVGGPEFLLTWRKKDDYIHLNMNGAGNSKGRLASPWLTPLPSHMCTLKFQYFNRKHHNCQLSLFRQTKNESEDLIWIPQGSTGWRSFSGTISQNITCNDTEFRMVFEGWRSCKVIIFNEIDLRAFRFMVHPHNETPPTEATPSGSQVFTIEQTFTGTPDSRMPDSTTSDARNSSTNVGVSSKPDRGGATDTQRRKTDNSSEQSGLDTGALVGIILAIVIIVIVVIVVVVIIVRRRRNKTEKLSGQQNQSVAVSNSTYMLNPGEIEGLSRNNRDHHADNTATEDNYELANPQQSSPPPFFNPVQQPETSPNNYEYIPMSHSPVPFPRNSRSELPSYTNTATPTGKNTYSLAYTTSQPSSVSVSDDTYDHTSRTPFPVVSENTYDHRSTGEGLPQDFSSGSVENYNHLQLRPQPFKTSEEDTYDHNQIQQSLGPDHEGNVQSQAPVSSGQSHQLYSNVESPELFAQSGGTDYEAVGDVDETMMSSVAGGNDVYNVLDVRGERGGERVVGENVYDHAKDDNYDSLQRERNRRRQQRQLAHEDYNHLG